MAASVPRFVSAPYRQRIDPSGDPVPMPERPLPPEFMPYLNPWPWLPGWMSRDRFQRQILGRPAVTHFPPQVHPYGSFNWGNALVGGIPNPNPEMFPDPHRIFGLHNSAGPWVNPLGNRA